MSVARWFRSSIACRLIVPISLVVALLFAAIVLRDLVQTRRDGEDALRSRAAISARLMAVSLTEPLWDIDQQATRATLGALRQDPDFVGAILYAPGAKGAGGLRIATIGAVGPDRPPAIEAEAQIVREGVDLGRLTIALGSGRLSARVAERARELLISGLVGLAVTIGLMLVAVRDVVRPIQRLTRSTDAVSAGKLNVALSDTGRADEIGRMARALAVFRSTAHEVERLHAERESDLKLRRIVDDLPVAITLYDRDGRVTIRNRLGNDYGDAEIPGLAEWRRTARDALAAGDNGPSPARGADIRLADGRILFGRATRLDDGTLVESLIDVSEARRGQDEIARSERLASIGLMVSGIAHEINTPVGVAVTAITTLQDRVTETDLMLKDEATTVEAVEAQLVDIRSMADVIGVNLNRAAALVQSFKQISSDQMLDERRPLRLGAYLEDVIRSLGPQIRRSGHAISIACERDFAITTDPGAISQIVTNLVTNAMMHAFPDGRHGTVTIQTEPTPRGARLVYRDDGVGAAPELRARMFEPFFSTRRGRGGTGLGLSVVHNLVVQKLGGRIEAADAPGGGLQIVIEIADA